MRLENDQPWFAIQVKCRLEKTVGQVLRYKGYEQFLPTYTSYKRICAQEQEVEIPLFPGYLFCRLNASASGLIVTTPGVVKIVGNGRTPIPVEAAEMEALQLVTSSRAKVRPCAYLAAGLPIKVISGPLAGLSGMLQESQNTRRVVVSINLLKRSTAVELEGCEIAPVVRQNSGRFEINETAATVLL
jgi:transcription antitermination factor NusG